MSEILINGKQRIEGKLTVTRTLDNSAKDLVRILVEGYLVTESYIEEIKRIETKRLSIFEVEVYHESFGSEDREIVYAFRAKDIYIEE